MNALTITAKGQITLKKDFLVHMGVAPGQQVEVIKMPRGELCLRPNRRMGKISDAFGILKREGQRQVSIEEMNDAIEKAWAGQS
jgi:bifunctional DNA-binding transcriptional regulator/antitoxin component of YhaV-PrlF toxin-antitoxin module